MLPTGAFRNSYLNSANEFNISEHAEGGLPRKKHAKDIDFSHGNTVNVPHNSEKTKKRHRKKKKRNHSFSDSTSEMLRSEKTKKRHRKRRKRNHSFNDSTSEVLRRKLGCDMDRGTIAVLNETDQLDQNKPTGEETCKTKKQECNAERLKDKTTEFRSESLTKENISEKVNEDSMDLFNQQNIEENFTDSGSRCESVEAPHTVDDGNDDEVDFYDLTLEELTFDAPPLHFKGSCRALTAEQRNDMKDQGIAIKRGRWSWKEDQILKQNWNQFAKKHGLKKPHLLLGLKTRKNSVIMRFIHAKNFYLHLGKGLDTRPINAIYLRARKLFDPNSVNNAEVSPDLLEEIEKWRSVYGNKWSDIGKHMGLTCYTISEIVRWHQKEKELGLWNEEEEENLIEAIKQVLKVDDINMVDLGIPWEEVAKLVPSRNGKQCRLHWSSLLCWKVNYPNEIKEKWNDFDTVRLINSLFRSNAESEEDVDWIELHRNFPNVASFYALRGKWRYIKQRVPRHAEKDFEDIVTYLYKISVPALVVKLGKSNIEEVLESS